MSRSLVLTGVLSLLLAGCAAVGPTYRVPAAPVAPAFRNAPPPGVTRSVETAWWTGFNDPLLTATVEQALAQNLDIAAAAARVTQARAAARAASAALLPAGQVQADYQHARQSLVGSNAQAAVFQRDVDLFDGGVGASWEIDLFGGLRRGREAARATAEAADAGLAGARLLIAAETADAYLQLRGFQSRLLLAQRRVRDDERVLELTSLLFDAGSAPRLQRDQAESVLAQAQATIPLLRLGVEAQLNRLAVLTGRPPETERSGLAAESSVPLPPPIPPGITPGDLLRNRPDVAAAERRLAAANAGIGVAIADYYPKVDLSGLIGFQSLSAGKLFSSDANAASFAGALRWRLFDFGRVDAEVANARGVYAEVLANWRGVVLSAAEDVENALAQQAEREAQLSRLQAASLSLEHARDASQAGYERGAVSLLNVIDTERQLLLTQDAAADVNTQRSRAAVALHRALGG